MPVAGVELNDLWADPGQLAARAAGWVEKVPGLAATERTAMAQLVARVPALFRGRTAVLAHGDFAPVNVMTDGVSLTGLLDFEAARLADPLFVRALQVLRMLELLVGESSLDPDVQRVVADRLRATLRCEV